MEERPNKAGRIARIAMIAAAYGAASLAAMTFMGSLAWGPVQFRISEALCVLALLTKDAIPGLTLGCVIANAANMATFVGATISWKLRRNPKLALLGPVLANGLIVPAYLPFMLQGLGFYTIPLTSINLDGAFVPMYVFGLIATGLGEAVVMYVLGLPLFTALRAVFQPEPGPEFGPDDMPPRRDPRRR